MIIFTLANILFWIDYLEIYKMKVQPLLGLIIFLMPITTVIYKKIIFSSKSSPKNN
jgi:hypothetical protein